MHELRLDVKRTFGRKETPASYRDVRRQSAYLSAAAPSRLAVGRNRLRYEDAECRQILMRCRERLQSEDRLLVIEMVPVPGRPDAGIALLDMAMMTFGGEARQRTETEYRELFAATALLLTRVVETGTAFSILEVRPSEPPAIS